MRRLTILSFCVVALCSYAAAGTNSSCALPAHSADVSYLPDSPYDYEMQWYYLKEGERYLAADGYKFYWVRSEDLKNLSPEEHSRMLWIADPKTGKLENRYVRMYVTDEYRSYADKLLGKAYFNDGKIFYKYADKSYLYFNDRNEEFSSMFKQQIKQFNCRILQFNMTPALIEGIIRVQEL